jgi:tRNA pseudouridine55 synthase
MNKIFVVDKPIFISSNHYLSRIKRKYQTKKNGIKRVGFSGTLDPFAKGCLIVAFGQYTKLFDYLQKAPKTYRATIWLGVQSSSFDIENIYSKKETKKIDVENIKNTLSSLLGDISYLPPKYSAKKIDGKRAYDLAREDIDFELKSITSTIYDVNLIHYTHPFITFDITVSEGSYIRSLAQIVCDKLGVVGPLSFLDRLNEGKFRFEDEKPIDDIISYLKIPLNKHSGTKEHFELGKKLDINYFQTKEDGDYVVEFDDFFAIIKIEDDKVSYKLNKIIKG